MKYEKKLIIGSLSVVFLMLLTPSISAIQYNTAITSIEQDSIKSFDQFKEKFEVQGCPATRMLYLWLFVCYSLIIMERIVLGSKPVIFVLICQITVRMMAAGIFFIHDYFLEEKSEIPTFLLRGWLRASPYDKFAAIYTSLYLIFLGIIRVSFVNMIFKLLQPK